MKKVAMVIPFIISIFFVIISMNVKAYNEEQELEEMQNILDNAIDNYNILGKKGQEMQYLIDSFEFFFQLYLEEVPNYYQKYFDQLNVLTKTYKELETPVQKLQQLCNIKLDNNEFKKICTNYQNNYQQVTNNLEKLTKAFNETITNYNNIAIYNENLETKELF